MIKNFGKNTGRPNHTKFARELNLNNKLNMWFGASSYGREFEEIPFEAFLPILRNNEFKFLYEEELPSNLKLENSNLILKNT